MPVDAPRTSAIKPLLSELATGEINFLPLVLFEYKGRGTPLGFIRNGPEALGPAETTRIVGSIGSTVAVAPPRSAPLAPRGSHAPPPRCPRPGGGEGAG
eukprot:3367058-Pyramimonas_sp.AAC.1